jgi:hypothetical protein
MCGCRTGEGIEQPDFRGHLTVSASDIMHTWASVASCYEIWIRKYGTSKSSRLRFWDVF